MWTDIALSTKIASDVHKATRRNKHTSDEQRIPRKHGLLLSILRKIADAILRMAGGMQSRDRNSLPDLEFLTVLWRLGDQLAVFPGDYGKFAELFELYG